MDSFISIFMDNAAENIAYFIIIISFFCIIIIGSSYYYDYLNKTKTLQRLDAYERSLKDLVEEFRSLDLLEE